MTTVFIISAPSGSGKSTLVGRLIQQVPGLMFSVSYTSRAPRHRDELVAIARSAGATLAHDRFGDFSAAMAGLSRDVRNWTGGHFAGDSYTAYDPIFWFHHANLDRLWSRWQRLHPAAPMPPALLAAELKPFSITVADILDIEKAGYRYDEANSAA